MSKKLWQRRLTNRVLYTGCGHVSLQDVNVYAGLLFNPGAWWVGVHWSAYNRRICINILPCFTVWITLRGGNQP